MSKATKILTLACSLAVLALLGAPHGVFADSIGPNCGSGECLGNIYTLNYSQTGAQMGTDHYTITLTIDSSGFVDGTDSGFLMAVAPNIPGWSSATLTSAPGGTGDWSATMAGGLDSSGCNGKGAPFFCNGASSQGAFNEVGSPTSLVFAWTLTDSSLPTGTNGAAIKAWYQSSTGSNLGITSADITLQPSATTVPEPATLGLFGIGLLGLAFACRRRQLKTI
jgi:hypothetical protein